MFGVDQEARSKRPGNSKPDKSKPDSFKKDAPVKDRAQLEKEARKFRGKRNSIGAKMAGFRGGVFKKTGGGIGDRDLSGKSKSM